MPKFIKPSLEELQAHKIHRMSKVDPEQFFEYYESVDWMAPDKKKKLRPMKSWKSAWITWERNDARYHPQSRPSLKPYIPPVGHSEPETVQNNIADMRALLK